MATIVRWEEDQIHDHTWWLMRYDLLGHGQWCALVAQLHDGLFYGLVASDPRGDQDILDRGTVFHSLDEARRVLEVEARLDGLCWGAC